MAKLNDSPCYGCGQRRMGCHCECKHYATYRTRQDTMQAERMREVELNHAAAETARKKARRHTNRWGGKG